MAKTWLEQHTKKYKSNYNKIKKVSNKNSKIITTCYINPNIGLIQALKKMKNEEDISIIPTTG